MNFIALKYNMKKFMLVPTLFLLEETELARQS